MNTSKAPLAVGLLIVLVSAGALCSKRQPARSVAPVSFASTPAPPEFSRDASTGLFVGVREFSQDKTWEVPYASDDAVDLASRFALDQRVALIPPRRVVLVLSGMPQKKESRERLRKLRDFGARVVTDASATDILQLLKEQSARAGEEGLFVLSIASHGFQESGDAYILGSTSDFGSPERSLRANVIFEIAAQARRSLLFLDTCRDRIGHGSRGADPATAAPHIRRMKSVRGQVIFYAAAPGQYAWDDHVHQNGVFTRAVLDGLACEASAPRGTVIVDTLHTYVDRAVRRWIRDNKKRDVNPATQISVEGQTRNMPLCECWRRPGPAIRVAVDGSTVTAYASDTTPLLKKDFGEPIVHAEAADLDADSLHEIVVGLRDRIVVLDRDGHTRWTKKNETRALRGFTTGDLFEKHTNQIVALWHNANGSRVTVLESDGGERSSFEFIGQLQRVAIGRATNMHIPKIVVTTSDSLLVFHPKKLDRGVPLWRKILRSAASDRIEGLQILGRNNDSRRSDIVVTTASGTTRFDFEGRIVAQKAKGTWEKASRQSR